MVKSISPRIVVVTADNKTHCSADSNRPELLCGTCRDDVAVYVKAMIAAASFPPRVSGATGVPPPPSFIEALRGKDGRPSQSAGPVVVMQANGVPAPPKFTEVMKSRRQR
jgi:hypothetical protein